MTSSIDNALSDFWSGNKIVCENCNNTEISKQDPPMRLVSC